jgi:hypothetical protein
VTTPRCHDCLTEDVTVKVIDLMGFEHWFCAEDWASWQEFHEKVQRLLGDAAAQPGDGE